MSTNNDTGCPVCGAQASEGCRLLRTGYVHSERMVPAMTVVLTQEVPTTPEQDKRTAAAFDAWHSAPTQVYVIGSGGLKLIRDSDEFKRAVRAAP